MTDANGAIISQTKYKAWGEVRQATGTSPTNYTYTGQYSYTADFGLMFYNARWYDPALGRFAQADTIIPGGVQGLDRYAYVNNSPMNLVDPTGHESGSYCDRGYCDADGNVIKSNPFHNARAGGGFNTHGQNNSPYEGTIFTGTETASQGEVYLNTNLGATAEQSYSSVDAPSINFAFDAASAIVGLSSDFSYNSPGYFPINAEINWSESDSGVIINNIEINNESPTYVTVDKIIFSNVIHSTDDYAMGDERIYGSPDNIAGQNGTLTMNVGVAFPKTNTVLTIDLSSTLGSPQNPYITIIISPQNLQPGCSIGPTINTFR